MELLSGNEAIARGAKDAGVKIATAYPGTPSTETLEAFAKFDGVYAEWCTNEKVAVEVALGASAAGARVLSTMKHVGVNVAADPIFTAAYTGVGGGMAILAADDPGMYSSQNEQDSHFYAAAAHIPMLDPADSEEAYQFAKQAYEISEEFDVPVFIRSSVRISHTKTPVSVGSVSADAGDACNADLHSGDLCAVDAGVDDKCKGNACDVELPEYKTRPEKWVMMPAFAKPARKVQLERIKKLESWADSSPLNSVSKKSTQIGVVCYGSCYQHVREAMPNASILKLGISYPMPKQTLQNFASSVKQLYVIEEGSNYLHDAVCACGIDVCENPDSLPAYGELTPGTIAHAFSDFDVVDAKFMQNKNKSVLQLESASNNLPKRPPALCPGCPHRLVFKELSRANAIVTGDIGCYTLGALPPLSAMDTTVDMGASVSMSHGMELAMAGKKHRPICAVIGDSTFAHSGLSSLISTVYNSGGGTICILDNRTTAMTGRQGNPFNGETLQGRTTREIDLEGVIRAIGVESVQTINPHNMKDVRRAIRGATETDELCVLIFKSPCALLSKKRDAPYFISDACRDCGVCLSLGCPAISKQKDGAKMQIDAEMCVGCGQCAQYCAFGAIAQTQR